MSMKPYNERFAEASTYVDQCMKQMEQTPEPKGQKFPRGAKVWIKRNLGESMSHFKSGCWATVVCTYAHAFGGSDVKIYELDIPGYGTSSWYHEHQLSEVEETLTEEVI